MSTRGGVEGGWWTYTEKIHIKTKTPTRPLPYKGELSLNTVEGRFWS